VFEEANRKLPVRNTTVQFLTVYTDPVCRNTQRYRRTDGQTDDVMMPRDDHGTCSTIGQPRVFALVIQCNERHQIVITIILPLPICVRRSAYTAVRLP